jgi:hypothetical protein
MAEVIKRLGTMAATAVTNIVDNGSTAGTYTVINCITICNTASSSATYTLSTGTLATATHGAYIAYTATVAANDTVALQLGICLDPTNRYLVGSASAATVYITAYGLQGP